MSKFDELLDKIDMTAAADVLLKLRNIVDETLLVVEELKTLAAQEYDIAFSNEDEDEDV